MTRQLVVLLIGVGVPLALMPLIAGRRRGDAKRGRSGDGASKRSKNESCQRQ